MENFKYTYTITIITNELDDQQTVDLESLLIDAIDQIAGKESHITVRQTRFEKP